MKTAYFFLMILGVCLLAGLVFGFFMGYADGTNQPTWRVFGGILAIVILGLGWRFRPKFDHDDAFMALMVGDMSDPKQRNAMIRMFFAAALHGGVLAVLFTDDTGRLLSNNDIGLFGYGLLAMFVITMAWLIVECWLFYMMDEFWRDLVMGPMAFSGLVVALGAGLWGAFSLFFSLPAISVVEVYFIYIGVAGVTLTWKMYLRARG